MQPEHKVKAIGDRIWVDGEDYAPGEIFTWRRDLSTRCVTVAGRLFCGGVPFVQVVSFATNEEAIDFVADIQECIQTVVQRRKNEGEEFLISALPGERRDIVLW